MFDDLEKRNEKFVAICGTQAKGPFTSRREIHRVGEFLILSRTLR